MAVVGHGLFSSVSIKKKKTFVGLKVIEPSKDKCPAQVQRDKNVDCMSDESKPHSEDRSGDSKSVEEEVDANMSDGDINIDVDGKEIIVDNVAENNGMSDYENESTCSHEDLSAESMSSIRESEVEDDSSNVTLGEESDPLELEHSSARDAPDKRVSEVQTQDSLFRRFHRKLKELMPFHFPGRPKSFQEYLNRIFERKDCMEVERLDILRRCSNTTVFQNNKLRALLAATFPPVTVGPMAGKRVPVTFEGDTFPQFSHNEKSMFRCEVCIPFQKWAMEKREIACTFKMSKTSFCRQHTCRYSVTAVFRPRSS